MFRCHKGRTGQINVLKMMNFVGRESYSNCNCWRSPKKHLFAVWILLCISRITSLFGVTRDPKSFVAKSHAPPNVPNRSLVSSLNHLFCLTFVDLQSASLLCSTDNVDIIGVTESLCLLVEYCAVRL
jgi:hypothetical protein